MRYIVIKKELIHLNSFYADLFKLWIEINENGEVTKEIGFDKNDTIIHLYPSRQFKYGKYGIFDLNILNVLTSGNDITKEEFYKIWGESFRGFNR